MNCVETDTYLNVWRKALAEIPHIMEPNPEFSEDSNSFEGTLADTLYEQDGPGEIRKLLASASQEDGELVIVFDEFDRLDSRERSLFADTIKDLSDNSINTTLVLVGVAKDVVELIAEHTSIDRCLTQILMPPMDRNELRDILNKAMKPLGMTIDERVANLIVSLSKGLPHYTHLLGHEATMKALHRKSLSISEKDMSGAIEDALEQTEHTTRNDYLNAAHGQRKGTLFPEILLACALAEVDELGYFSSADVREPLCTITGKKYKIQNFSPHLAKFCNDSHGPVLEKWGKTRRFKFRFRNPLLRPFIIMKGLAERKITGNLLELLADQEPVKREEHYEQKSLFD